MNGRRSILLLGGSAQQVVAIDKARELGYRAVLCDYLPDNPGQHHADSFHLVSTTDREAVLAVAREEGVEGVLAYASDPAAATAAYVSEELGLPGNPLASVEALSEKHLFRAMLEDAGLPCPRSAAFSAEAPIEKVLPLLEGLRWPVVVKPTDSSGSKGVSVLEGPSELDAAIRRASAFSRNGILIAEEYIRRGFPDVIGGDVFVADGEVRFWGLMRCLRDEALGGLVPVGEVMPSGLSADQESAVKGALQRLVSHAGIRFGELNVEVMVGEDGLPYILELGARAGGNMIPVQLTDASGVDLVATNVLCSMGEDPGNVDFDGRGACCAHYVVHSRRAGVFERLEVPDEVASCVYRTVMYKDPGDPVEPFDGADKAVGILFMRFGDEGEASHILAGISGEVGVVLR